MKILNVRVLLGNKSSKSARRNGPGLPASTFNRITRNELKCHPDQIRVGHRLIDNNFQRQLNFAHGFVRTCQNNKFLTNIVIGDKACFSRNGSVNKLVMAECMR